MESKEALSEKDLVDILSEHDRQITRHLGEAYVMMDHFIPRMEKAMFEWDEYRKHFDQKLRKTHEVLLEDFNRKTDQKMETVSKACHSLAHKSLCWAFGVSIILGIFFGAWLSDWFYFEDARVKKMLEYKSDIEIMAYLRKRGVGVYKDVIVAPPRVVKSTGMSTKGDHGIWLKP